MKKILILIIIFIIINKINTKEINFDKYYYNKNEKIIYTIKKNKIRIYKNFKLDKKFNIKKYNNIDYIIGNKKLIILKTKNKIIAIGNKKEKILWEKPFKNENCFKFKLNNKSLILDKYGVKIKSINNKNGEKIWNYKNNIDNFFLNIKGKLIETKKNLLYILPNKKILLIKKINGEKINSINLNKNLKNIIIKKSKIYNNILYTCYQNGNFEIINLNSGKKIFNNNKKNYKNFFINKKNIIILKKNGKIIKINKFNGKKIWSNDEFKNKNIDNILFNKNIIINCNNNIYLIDNEFGKISKSMKIKKIKKIKKNLNNILLINKNNINKIYLK